MNTLYRLTQFKDFGFLPDKAHTMLVVAETEQEARDIAYICETEERECGQNWGIDSASCVEIDIGNMQKSVLLVS